MVKSGWAAEYAENISAERCQAYDTKQSGGKGPLILRP